MDEVCETPARLLFQLGEINFTDIPGIDPLAPRVLQSLKLFKFHRVAKGSTAARLILHRWRRHVAASEVRQTSLVVERVARVSAKVRRDWLTVRQIQTAMRMRCIEIHEPEEKRRAACDIVQ
jgi:hypothetical protein